MTIGKSEKHGFNDIITLHVHIHPSSDPSFIGTEFIFNGVTDKDIQKAKDLFLIFSGEMVFEETRYGEVLEKKNKIARIYINGVKVAEKENFLFSYNITSLTKKIRQALNRERTNVGRSAYSDRVKSILLSCKCKEVAEFLINDLENYCTGEMHDELKWIDVQEHAVKILNATQKVVFLTSSQLTNVPNMVDEARSGGYKIITIPENLEKRIRGLEDISGNTIRDLKEFYKEYKESFEFKFVNPDEFTPNERKIFDMTNRIFSLIGGKPSQIKMLKLQKL